MTYRRNNGRFLPVPCAALNCTLIRNARFNETKQKPSACKAALDMCKATPYIEQA